MIRLVNPREHNGETKLMKPRNFFHPKLESLEQRMLLAGDVSLLAELNTDDPNYSHTNAGEHISVDGSIWVSGLSGMGPILWKTEGGNQPAETLLFTNVRSTVRNLTQLGSKILFNLTTESQGQSGLWSIEKDGSSPMQIGPAMSSPVQIGDSLYFWGRENDYLGQGIWRTDGTAEGTTRIYWHRGPQNVGGMSDLAAFDGELYAVFFNTISGARHLSTIDKETGEVTPLAPYPHTHVQAMYTTSKAIVLAGGFSVHSSEMLSYLPGANELVSLSSTYSLVGTKPAENINGRIYFPVRGNEWWSTDGTLEGTEQFLDSSIQLRNRSIALAESSGRYLLESNRFYYLSDGTPEGTQAIGLRGTSVHAPIIATPDAFYIIAFPAHTQDAGLYSIDPTSGAFRKLTSINYLFAQSPPSQYENFAPWPTLHNERLLFIDRIDGQAVLIEYDPATDQITVDAETVGSQGEELFLRGINETDAWARFDNQYVGIDLETSTVNVIGDLGGDVRHSLVVDDGLLYETYGSVTRDYSRWLIPNDESTPRQLGTKDSSAASGIIRTGTGYVQVRATGNQGVGLYSLNSDLEIISNLGGLTGDSWNYPREYAFGSRALLQGNGQLWVTDGTESGTVRIDDESSQPLWAGLIIQGESAWWIGVDRGLYELAVGSVIPQKRFQIPDDIHPTDIALLPTGFVFLSNSRDRGIELWSVDGAFSELQRLVDFDERADADFADITGTTNGRVIITTRSDISGFSLWSSGGTTETTHRLKHIPIGSNRVFHDNPFATTSLPDGRILFPFFDEETGMEPWISDGTVGGTQLYADIEPGPGNSFPTVVSSNNKIVFTAETQEYGARELFYSDYDSYVPEMTQELDFWVDENAVGAAVGEVTLADVPQTAIQNVELTDASGKFELDQDSRMLRLRSSASLDFELQASYQMQARVNYSDQNNELESREIPIVVSVVDLLEPLVVEDQVFEVDENTPRNSFIGQIELEKDPRLNISFMKTGGTPFWVDPKTGVIRTPTDESLLDYERRKEMLTSVRVSGLENHNIRITIRLRDLDESPEFSSEETRFNMMMGEQLVHNFPADFAIDPEGGLVEYSVASADGSELPDWGDFDSTTRSLTLTPSYTAPTTFSMNLVAADSTGNSTSHPILLAVHDAEFAWHNHFVPFDVNNDRFVAPVDALIVIQTLNEMAGWPDNSEFDRFVDTNKDSYVTPLDALLVINFLNTSGEGESFFDLGLASLHEDIRKLQIAAGNLLLERR